MKRNNSQSNKVFKDISDFFFDKKPVIKNSSYYTKLYSPKESTIKEKISSNNSFFPNKTIQSTFRPKRKSFSLKKVFSNPPNSRNTKIKWPKITHPKWPFTKKRTEPKELIEKRILSSKPSHKYHDFNTIKWLGQKYSDSVKEKSIYSLLPNNGKPIVPEYESEFDKRHRQMLEYLESFKGPGGREKFVNINPKYFYDNTTFRKILKLKEMFLEFDKKGNHKIIIKEIVNLFKQNNIDVDINEIKELFFKNLKVKNKKDEAKNLLYLDFYQFMNFALKREQDFRQFMRNVKEKNKIEENSKNLKTFTYNNNEKTNNVYIPMNFNLIFDYLINKEKQRNSLIVVENAIKEMDKIIRRGNDKDNNSFLASPEKEKKKKNEIKKNILNSKTLKTDNKRLFNLHRFHKANTNSKIDKNKTKGEKLNNYFKSQSTNKIYLKNFFEKEKDEKINKINFAQLIKEFYSLFGLEEKNENYDLFEDKENEKNKEINIKCGSNKSYTEEMKKQLRINTLKEINNNNFEKYHDLKLTLSATKEQIKKMKNNNLIQDELDLYNMVDIRDILNRDANFPQSSKLHNKLSLNSIFKGSKNLENLDNSLNNRENNYKSNMTEYNKTLKVEKSSNRNRNKYRFKKPLYNFYWGKPQIMNIGDDYMNYHNIKRKYDYVPNEFLSSKKRNKK